MKVYPLVVIVLVFLLREIGRVGKLSNLSVSLLINKIVA